MNHADFLDAWIHVLDPMRAEVRLRLHEPTGQLRGRLMGPRSRFTTTIEIAYPFRQLSANGEFAAIVPEPSLWSPAKPFIYEGPVERVDPNGKADEAWLLLCFRTLNIGPRGLVLNGKELPLRGKELSASPQESELLEMRGQGFNAVLPNAGQADLGELADRLGFLLVRREPAGAGGHGGESFSIRLDELPEAGTIRLPGITRQGDGTFAMGS